jgi:hypothetical protein
MVPILTPGASTHNLDGARLTNRSKNTPKSGVPLVDTIKVSGLIHGFHMPEHLVKRRITSDGEFSDEVVYAKVPLPSGGRIIVHRAQHGELRGSLERSLPTMLDGINLQPVSVDVVPSLVAHLQDQASEWVEWQDEAADLRVSRLDLDRDFVGVEHLDHLLRRLANLRVPRLGNPRVYYDYERGGAATLVREPKKAKTWRATLYDKHAQVAHLATVERDPTRRKWLTRQAEHARGHLRFEVQVKTQALREQGVTTVADLDEQHLLDLREHYFRRVRFDTPVHGAAHLRALAARLSNGDPECNFLGPVMQMLYFEALGLPPPYSHDTLVRYRKLARRWEISAADIPTDDGPPVTLDYETGALRDLEAS